MSYLPKKKKEKNPMTEMVVDWRTPQSVDIPILGLGKAGTSSELIEKPLYGGTSFMPPDFRITSSQVELQFRLRARLPKILEEARSVRETHPDPINELGQILNDLGIDYDTWRRVLEEGYE
jgi:hypothetical protein